MAFLAVILFAFLLKDAIASRLTCSIDGKVDSDLTQACHLDYDFSCSPSGIINYPASLNDTCIASCHCTQPEVQAAVANRDAQLFTTPALSSRSEDAALSEYQYSLQCPSPKDKKLAEPGKCNGGCRDFTKKCALKHGYSCEPVSGQLATYPDSDHDEACFNSCFCARSYVKRGSSDALLLEPSTSVPPAAEIPTLEERSSVALESPALEKRHDYHLKCINNRTWTDRCNNLSEGFGYSCSSTGRVRKLGSTTGHFDDWCRDNCNCESFCPKPRYNLQGMRISCASVDDETSLVHSDDRKFNVATNTVTSVSESASSSEPVLTQTDSDVAIPNTTFSAPDPSMEKREKKSRFRLDCGDAALKWICHAEINGFGFYCSLEGELLMVNELHKKSWQSKNCQSECKCSLRKSKTTKAKTTKPKTTKSKSSNHGHPSTLATSTTQKREREAYASR